MIKYRIVNKNEKGCILNILPQGLTEITWEEFNRKYLIKEKIYAILNPAWQERQDKLENLLKEAAGIFERNNSVEEPNPEDSKRLNEISSEIMKLAHVNVDKALTMIREKVEFLHKRKENRKTKKVKKQDRPVYRTSRHKSTTLEDACPGLAKLKESLK